MKYNATKYVELIDEQSRLAKEKRDLSAHLNDEYESSKDWDDARRTAYTDGQMRHGQLSRDLDSVTNQITAMSTTKPKATKVKGQRDAFKRWLADGKNGLEASEQALYLAESEDATLPRGGGEVFRISLATTSDTASGQEAVEETIVPRVIDDLLYFGGVAPFAYNFSTATGNDYRFMNADNASTRGRIIAAQNTAIGSTDMANITVNTFKASTSTSDFIYITREMIQDSIFDVQGYAERIGVRRIGRIWNDAFTLGDGSGGGTRGRDQCRGVVVAATAGITSATASVVTWPEMNSLKYSINRAYRQQGGEFGEGGFMTEMGGVTGYMISDGMEQLMSNLVDGDSRPLWKPSTREGDPETLNGSPYIVNGNMAAPTTSGNIPMLFGNFSYMGLRTVTEIEIFRFMDSGTMANNAVAVLVLARRDGRPIAATSGTFPATVCEAWAKLTML